VGSCLCLTSVTAVLARQFVSVRMVASLSGELQHQALHDPLTGLANRALLADRMSHGLAAPEREPVVLLLADLDGFKAVNDTLGHQAGDELLIEAAARLQTIVRHEDTVARLGGDEFAVLLRSVSGIVDARQVADRIIRELRRPVRVAGVDAVVGASIGIALSQVGATAQELLREADVAMYAAKAQGRNRAAVYAPGLASASLTRRRMQADLADALASDQLTLKYQPIIDLTSGRLVGVEALLRWHHPVYGEVPPVAFIPLAEDSGDIIAIGRWVIERACADAGRWHGMRAPGAPELRLSVNLSGRQLADPGLVDIVRGALCASTLPADLLCLEITESVLLNVTDASNPLRALRDLGVHLAVDDFGTGQSALSRLRDLPVDTLKIDRSFVDALTADGSDATNADVVFSAILHMGRGLAIDVVAEGVETEDQLDALRALGCHHGQGFLIARPADPAVIDDLVRTPITLLDEAPGAPHPSH
jgi:diguanylate cyclase (GGDEF)-like protein